MARLVRALESSVDDVDAVLDRISDVLFHKAAKARQVGRHARDAHDSAFGCNKNVLISEEKSTLLSRSSLTWRVAPRFIVAWEDAQMTATNKLLVVHGQQGAGALQKLRMEYDLDPVISVVE